MLMRVARTISLLVGLLGVLGQPGTADCRTKAAAAAAPPAQHPQSVLDPSYDVLLPDPEPSEAAAGSASAAAPPDLDITEQVLSAAKQLRTVQEAPALVSVIPAEDIRARGYRTLGQALETIPGWQNAFFLGNLANLPTVRGTPQAALLLRDGISFFEPTLNLSQANRALPLETVKSIEVVTGPGGVLWGANSFLGIINLLPKEAEDINGLEGAIGYGDGNGSPQDVRAWAQFGKSWKVRGVRIAVVQHISYENYLSPRAERSLLLYRSSAPSPTGPNLYGPVIESNPARAFILNVDGRFSFGPVTLSYSVPLAEMNTSLSFGSTVTPSPIDPVTKQRTNEPLTNYLNAYDRYVTLQLRRRFLNDRLGLDIKSYGIQFVREFNTVIAPPTTALPSGQSFQTSPTSYRVGITVDSDAVLPRNNRLRFGGEAFYEFLPPTEVRFPGANPQALSISCPVETGSTIRMPVFVPDCPLTFAFATSRAVAAVYAANEWRPVPRLALDGGIRYQAGFGQRGYQGAVIGGTGQLLGSASIVWNLYREMYMKANYANGFRPPVFNNTDSNGAAVQYGGNQLLRNEQSHSAQVEWNARVLRNVGPIRALQLRADYSYTLLDGLILVSRGRYQNSRIDSASGDGLSQRYIHAVEASARMRIATHDLSLGYSFLNITTNDRGLLRSVSPHNFSAGWVIALIPGWLDWNGTLLIYSTSDDPNITPSTTLADGTTVATASDLTFDRLPPYALLNSGLRARFLKDRLWTSIHFFNILNQRYYYPDQFYSPIPTEGSVTPAAGFSFFLQVGGKPF